MVVLLLLSLAGIVPVYAQPVVGVSPDRGHAGSIVLVYGSGFTPYSNITIYFDAGVVGETVADDYGGFYTYIQVPLDAVPGQHIIRAEDSFGLEKSTEFLVTQPRIAVSPSSGAIETRVSISVEGLTPYEAYIVKFDDITLYPYLLSDGEGTISIEATIPAATKGDHYIRIIYAPAFWGFLVEPIEVVKARFEITNGVATTKDIQELRDLINGLDSKIDDVNETLYSLVLELKNNIISVNQSLTNYIDEQIGMLRDTVNDLAANIKSLAVMLDEFEGEARENITLLQNHLALLMNRVDDINSTILNALDLISVLESKIMSLNESFSAAASDLLSRIKQLRTGLSQVSSTLDTLSSKLDELEKSLGDTRSELETRIQDTAASLSGGLDKLKNSVRQENQKLLQRIKELEQQLNKTNEELAVAKQQNTILAITALAIGIAATALGAYAAKKGK